MLDFCTFLFVFLSGYHFLLVLFLLCLLSEVVFDILVLCFTLMWPMWWIGCWIPGTYLSRTIKSSHSETSGNSEYGFACFLFTYCLCFTGGPHHQTVQWVQGQGFQVWWDGGSASWRPQEAAESCPWSARLGWWRCWHGCKRMLRCVRMKGRDWM